MKLSSRIIISAGIAIALSSCSIFTKQGKPQSGTIKGDTAENITGTATEKPTVTTVEETNTAVTETNTTTSTNSAAGQTSDTAEEKAPQRPTVANTELARELSGEWQIISVGATSIDRDDNMPYIYFEPAQAMFYANNGCNTLNGSFALSEDNTISFFGILSTLKLCQDITFDNEINVIISDNTSHKLKTTQVGQETFLEFIGENDRTVMKLRRGNLEFLNGQWDIISINGLEKLEVPANVFFDLTELKVHGNTGCNYFNGAIYLDHRRSNAIDFSNMGVTRMACPYTSQETAILVALEQTATAIAGHGDNIMLLDSNGHELMTLRRAAKTTND